MDDEILQQFWHLFGRTVVTRATAAFEEDPVAAQREFLRLKAIADGNALELVKFVLANGLELLGALKPKED